MCTLASLSLYPKKTKIIGYLSDLPIVTGRLFDMFVHVQLVMFPPSYRSFNVVRVEVTKAM